MNIDPLILKGFFNVGGYLVAGVLTIIGTIITVRNARKANDKTATISANQVNQANWAAFSEAQEKRLAAQEVKQTTLEARLDKTEAEIDELKKQLLIKEQELQKVQKLLFAALDFIRQLLAFISRLAGPPIPPSVPRDLQEQL